MYRAYRHSEIAAQRPGVGRYSRVVDQRPFVAWWTFRKVKPFQRRGVI